MLSEGRGNVAPLTSDHAATDERGGQQGPIRQGGGRGSAHAARRVRQGRDRRQGGGGGLW
eukprot:scaffold78375_cov43-Phaeocystis_antarctica.AAC.1